jgi:iron-sulfur cluster repair protein YtfE (RIC family)
MSQAMTDAAADRRAASAVIGHHRQMHDELTAHADRLRAAAVGDDVPRLWSERDALVDWLRTELVPHAVAEESALYPAAAARSAGRLLVEGMLAEHRAITDLVGELASADTPVAAVAAARALSALFAVHLAKENDLILPLLLATDGISLAGLLEGMHAVLGAAESGRDV